jgi:hypothetical protein
MRTSLIVASLGVAMAALTAGIAPSNAEPVSNAYPYCLFGRGGGSTTCYFRSRAECGNGCVNNPAYVGDQRARAILASVGLGEGTKANGARNAPAATKTIAAIDPAARASASDGFEGWPTSYLVNRFGDHQAQGRF